MADYRRELRSRYDSLRRLYEDLSGTAFARLAWNSEVMARRTLGSDERIEHWFLAEHFLVTWSNWCGLFDRFCRYFGQPVEAFPKTWAQLIAKCEILVFQLARDRELDKIMARSWFNPDHAAFRPDSHQVYDISTMYTQLAKTRERSEFLVRAEAVKPRLAPKEKMAVLGKTMSGHAVFPVTRKVIDDQNEGLLERWQELPRRVQDQVWVHKRHYLHTILGVSWLFDFTAPGLSALMGLSWGKQYVCHSR